VIVIEVITAALVLVTSFVACQKASPTSPSQTPAWLTTLIQSLESAPSANPPAFIARYEYRGQVVYYLPAPCCDVLSNLYAVDGTILCHPDGGFTGTGDGRCQDFFTTRRNERIVWRDPRAG